MIKQLLKRRSIIYIALLLVISTQGCLRAGLNSPSSLPTARDIDQVTAEEQTEILATPTLLVKKTPSPTPPDILPTGTSSPKVTISAVKGNLYIRRGPGLAYNMIGVLYKDTSAEVTARDVLSKWVQIVIPDSKETGWVSIQTQYSQLNGEFDALPDFTTTDLPIPAYLINCTHHDMYVMPGDIVLPSSLFYPANSVWLNPGSYTVQDLFVPGEPQVLEFDIREGLEIKIQKDGLDEHRKC